MVIHRSSVLVQQRMAEESLQDIVVLEKEQVIDASGGRIEHTGIFDEIERTRGRVGLMNSADPSQVEIAERLQSQTVQLLSLPLTSLVEIGHRATVHFKRGGTIQLWVRAVLPRTTHATLTRTVCEEV